MPHQILYFLWPCSPFPSTRMTLCLRHALAIFCPFSLTRVKIYLSYFFSVRDRQNYNMERPRRHQRNDSDPLTPGYAISPGDSQLPPAARPEGQG